MAHITRHNFKRLGVENTTSLPIKIYRSDRDPILHNDSMIDYWFTDLEINQLLLLKALVDSDYDRYGGVLKLIHIITPEDDYSWVYKPIPPAFHEEENCPLMKNNYENFRFPANFNELYKKDVVEYFRIWFKQEGEELLRTDERKFKNYVESRWPGKYQEDVYFQINWQDFIDSQTKAINSGKELIANPKISDVIREIDALKRKFIVFKDKLPLVQRKYLLKYMRRIYKIKKKEYDKEDQGMSDGDKKELKNNIEKFQEEFKYPMLDYLLFYYSLKAGNADLQFEKTILEQFGFRSCSYCYPR